MEMHLNKFLRECRVTSRRDANRVIESGRVAIDGIATTNPMQLVHTDKNVVLLDGKRIMIPSEQIYIALNKPRGYITTRQDKRGRRTVFELLPSGGYIFTVGRLDMDTEGLLLATTDGELAHRLMNPRYRVRRVYIADVLGHFTSEEIVRVREGVHLDGGVVVKSARIKKLGVWELGDTVEVTLRDGRYHEVRRLCLALGHSVRRLKRVAFGGVRMKSIPRGKWRTLTESEVKELKSKVGLDGN